MQIAMKQPQGFFWVLRLQLPLQFVSHFSFVPRLHEVHPFCVAVLFCMGVCLPMSTEDCSSSNAHRMTPEAKACMQQGQIQVPDKHAWRAGVCISVMPLIPHGSSVSPRPPRASFASSHMVSSSTPSHQPPSSHLCHGPGARFLPAKTKSCT